tara:strand:+ start:357 stop:1163 length:807 start_codon:yes stop_codon:yes gene_type:complete
MKHNKKRNTAFLYEALIRDLTKSMINKDIERQKVLVAVLKEHFRKGTLLARELSLYKTVAEASNLPASTAQKLLNEVKYERSRIDDRGLFDEQTALIKRINKSLSGDVYNNFIPQYKSLATIAQLFSPSVSIRKRVVLEEGLVKQISTKNTRENLKTTDNVVYNSFVKRFNEEYSSLLEEQQRLLSTYVSSFADNGLQLKIYLNEEIGRLKERVKIATTESVIVEDETMAEKTHEVLQLLESYRNKEITPSLLKKVLKVQNFVRELDS